MTTSAMDGIAFACAFICWIAGIATFIQPLAFVLCIVSFAGSIWFRKRATRVILTQIRLLPRRT